MSAKDKNIWTSEDGEYAIWVDYDPLTEKNVLRHGTKGSYCFEQLSMLKALRITRAMKQFIDDKVI